ncbi:unnamed protein product, partial [Allacma fusca]
QTPIPKVPAAATLTTPTKRYHYPRILLSVGSSESPLFGPARDFPPPELL